jgi:hypothetical protein
LAARDTAQLKLRSYFSVPAMNDWRSWRRAGTGLKARPYDLVMGGSRPLRGIRFR